MPSLSVAPKDQLPAYSGLPIFNFFSLSSDTVGKYLDTMLQMEITKELLPWKPTWWPLWWAPCWLNASKPHTTEGLSTLGKSFYARALIINFNKCLERCKPRQHYSFPTSLLEKHRGPCVKLYFGLQSKSQLKAISHYLSLVKTSYIVPRCICLEINY